MAGDVVADFTQHGPFTYAMVLVRAGDDRLRVMRVLRGYRPDLGPAAAKALLDSLPQRIVTVTGHDEMERVGHRFAEVGAVVEWADDPPA